MFYIVYKITNNLNDKIYIGKHKTSNIDDGYMGSGKYLKRAMGKYGIENFTREVLSILDSEEAMDIKEAEFVTEEFCALDTNYNLCPGGKGGFGYINSNGLNGIHQMKILMGDDEWKNNWKKKHASGIANISPEKETKRRLAMSIANSEKSSWVGKKHSKESKQRMSKSKIGIYDGEKNPSFGSIWITNDIEEKKIVTADIPFGWRRGRLSRKRDLS